MPEHSGAGLTVIVVDDCGDIRQMMRFMLEARGYRVSEAENGRAAVELAERKCPDLILMDLNMPVLDGFAATRPIRQIEVVCHVPIIAFSAGAKESYRAAAFAAGCNAYVTKPIDFNELDHMMRGL